MQAPQTLLGPLTDRPRRNQSAGSDPASDRTAAGHHAGLLVKRLDPFSTRHGLARRVSRRADSHARADRGGAIARHTPHPYLEPLRQLAVSLTPCPTTGYATFRAADGASPAARTVAAAACNPDLA